MADEQHAFERLMGAACQRSQELYKSVGEVDLAMHMFRPTVGHDTPRPAIVFFHGGGWTSGRIEQFFPQCQYFTQRGMVAMTAEYRLGNEHGVSPFECVADARSAMRWVRAKARTLGIDPTRIAAGGGSAGGHLAACTALIEPDSRDINDLDATCLPDALTLLNPVLDTSPAGFGFQSLNGRAEELSPLAHVHPATPPTLIMHGTADTITPLTGIEQFQSRMHEAGNRCDLIRFDGREHGFFNAKADTDWTSPENADFVATTRAIDAFLTSLGWLAEPAD